MKIHKGQMLIEILVGIGVAVVALLAISRISSRSVINVNSAIRQSQASNYALTAIQKVKELKNNLGLAGKTDPIFANNAVWCFDGSNIQTSSTDYCTITNTEYQGRISMTQSTINSKIELGVVAEVKWTEGTLTRTVKNETKLVFEQ